jgi:hypothetical protein
VGHYIYCGIWTKEGDYIDSAFKDSVLDEDFYVGKTKISGCFRLGNGLSTSYLQDAYNKQNPSLSDALLKYEILWEEAYPTLDAYKDFVKSYNLEQYALKIVCTVGFIVNLIALALFVPICSSTRRADLIGKNLINRFDMYDKALQSFGVDSMPVHIPYGADKRRLRLLKEFCFEHAAGDYFMTVYLRKTVLGYRAHASITPAQVPINLTEKNIKRMHRMFRKSIVMADRLLTREELDYLQGVAMKIRRQKIENVKKGSNNEHFSYRVWGTRLSIGDDKRWLPLANTVFRIAVYGSNRSKL